MLQSTFLDDHVSVENANEYGHTHLFEVIIRLGHNSHNILCKSFRKPSAMHILWTQSHWIRIRLNLHDCPVVINFVYVPNLVSESDALILFSSSIANGFNIRVFHWLVDPGSCREIQE